MQSCKYIRSIARLLPVLLSGTVWTGAAFCQTTAASSPGNGRRPNILIIISDDHAFQAIGAYGSKLMATPGIDRLAKEGAVFTNAFVTNSICGPSRASILTGKYSHKNGFKDNLSRFDASQDIFVKRLRTSGYQTAWVGKWHLETTPQGFDYFDIFPGQGYYYNPVFIGMDGKRVVRPGYATNLVTDLAEDWLGKRDTSRPFCLIVGHKATHRTWIPDTVDLGRLDKVQFPLPENFYDTYDGRYAAAHQDMNIEHTMRLGYDLKVLPDTGFGKENYTRMNPAQRKAFDNYYRPIEKDFLSKNLTGRALTEWKYQRYMHDYLSTAASLDRNIGRLLDYLDQHGLTGNTLVIYMSDQGFYLGEHGWFDKRFMYEESMKTPMLARFPGLIKPGQVVKDLVMNVDIAPTALDLAGVAIPDSIQGKSMLPLFRHTEKKSRDAVYYHYYEYGEHSVIPHFGVRTTRYKLIRFYQVADRWELYDLAKDPHEMHNLYGKDKYQNLAAALKKRLQELITEFDDQEAGKVLRQEVH
jgi:arylsulfatase A-like enzyme